MPGIARAAVDIGRAEIGLGELNELLADGACRGRPLIVGVVHRLAVVGADIARGAAEGDLIPAVIRRVKQVRDLAGADGAHDGGAVLASARTFSVSLQQIITPS